MHFEVNSESLMFLLFLPCFSPKAPFSYPCALQCVQHNWKYFLRLFAISTSLLAKGDSEKLNQTGLNKPKKSATEGSVEG